MHRFILLLVVALPLFMLCARASAQNPPPTQAAVQAALAQEGQQRTLIRTLEAQKTALQRAAILLSQDPTDQASLDTVRAMLAESKRQLEIAIREHNVALAVLKDAEVPKSHP